MISTDASDNGYYSSLANYMGRQPVTSDWRSPRARVAKKR
jgi:hypothetical protein